MMDIGKGSWLECIRSDRCGCGCNCGIAAGSVYQVADLIPPWFFGYSVWECLLCGQQKPLALVLVGLDGHAFCPCCFKPAGYRPSESIQRLLDAPVTVKEDA